MTHPNQQNPASASGTVTRGQRILRLARKEVRESLRDRRTLVTLVFMPVLVYPLLGVVIQRFSIASFDPSAPPSSVLVDQQIAPADAIVLLAESESDAPAKSPQPDSKLPEGSEQLREDLTDATDLQQALLQQMQPDRVNLRFAPERFPAEVISEAVANGQADVGVIFEQATAPPMDSPSIRILTREGDPQGELAAAEITTRVRRNRDTALRTLLRDTVIGPRPVLFVEQTQIEVDGPQESPLGAFVPLMLLLMTMTGAVYPSIDLTAGERERGTLEMLLAAPISRRDLLLAKFFTVLLVAVLTAIVNLIAMTLTLIASGFDQVIFAGNLTLATLLQLFLLLVVFAAFFSAVLLSITSLARSFREAQAWLIPLMLISLAPGVLSLLPGVRLSLPLAVTPLVNIVLLARDLMQGQAQLPLFLITLAATTAWAVAAVNIAASVFDRDLLASRRTVARKRPNATGANTPATAPLAWKCLAIIVPCFVILPGLRGRLVSPENISAQLMLSASILVLLLVLIPLVVVRLKRCDIPASFALYPVRFLQLAGGMLLGVSIWMFVYEILILCSDLSVWQKFLENAELQNTLDRLMNSSSLPLKLFCLALIPAACEEFFFRGLLFNSFSRDSMSQRNALLLTTLLFAAAHIITDASLTLERFPGTFLLGLILGSVRIRTGSILPGIAFHSFNNGILLSLDRIAPALEDFGISLNPEGQTHLPAALLIAAIPVAIAGWILLTPRKKA